MPKSVRMRCLGPPRVMSGDHAFVSRLENIRTSAHSMPCKVVMPPSAVPAPPRRCRSFFAGDLVARRACGLRPPRPSHQYYAAPTLRTCMNARMRARTNTQTHAPAHACMHENTRTHAYMNQGRPLPDLIQPMLTPTGMNWSVQGQRPRAPSAWTCKTGGAL